MNRLYRTSPCFLLAGALLLLSSRVEANIREEIEPAAATHDLDVEPASGALALSLLSLQRGELLVARDVSEAIGGARFLVAKVAALDLEPAPSRFPVAGPCHLSSPFGVRRDPVTGRRRFHRGLDVPADPGTPVLAAGHGRVVRAGRMHGYGNVVILDHGGGVRTRYAHLRHIDVRVGALVHSGDRIASVGSTGRTTGPHLHFEVRVGGRPVNPMRFGLCHAD